MNPTRRIAGLAVFLLLPASGLDAQVSSSLGIGVAYPYGDFGDNHGSGFTVRGQAALSLPLVKPHLQVGWSRFPWEGKRDESGSSANIYHAGVGARLGLGIIWVGANGAYFFGDGDKGFTIFPEAGVGFWILEVVGDLRVTSGSKWAAIRAGLRF
jgi:hypothetical protein